MAGGRRGASASLSLATDALASRHPQVARLRSKHGPVRLGRRPRVDDRFRWLAQSIAYQQLSGRAAATIWSRVEDQLGGSVTPAAVLAAGEQALRAAGLSGAKAASLLDLSTRAADSALDLGAMGRLDDEGVIEHLVRVRGIGRWTAEMFLIFALHRLDVWPVDDLGVRKGYAKAFGLLETPSARDLDPLGDPFRPYRTVVTLYCWQDLETVLPT
jgi:DNA-3-methyladenine glycosylase II